MLVPTAFDRLSSAFHQDWDVAFSSLEEAIQESVRGLTLDEKIAATAFLNQVLNGGHSNAQLVDMWNKTSGGAGGFCIESGASWFLEKLRPALIESQ
jgi:hypothetical protein